MGKLKKERIRGFMVPEVDIEHRGSSKSQDNREDPSPGMGGEDQDPELSLAGVESQDIFSIKFLAPQRKQVSEPTLVTFNTPNTSAKIMASKEPLKNWGIKLAYFHNDRYPALLLVQDQPASKSVTHSLFRPK
ncbi:hypothetical protein NDU88_009478 [Pleurodeles waltl]|uniref:Uncharacterized protein n=1 Tax=Pleurodeles waltl TaxID=8319 RepID=A0AAV7QUM9_PLEWA|nr:hypothetical protein NDU88_009478 [Pleurodeles waltl]